MAEPPALNPPPNLPANKQPAVEEEDEVEASRAPLLDHLLELRKRIIVAVIAVGVGFGITFAFAGPLYYFLIGPFSEAMEEVRGAGADEIRLIFTQPLEFFFVKLKLALFGGIVLAFPVIAYQTYAFIAPGLYKRERATVLPYLIASPVLFTMGAALVYFFVLPFVMRFSLNQEMAATPVDLSVLPEVIQYCPLLGLVEPQRVSAMLGRLGEFCQGLSADELGALTSAVAETLAARGTAYSIELLPRVSEYLSLVTTLILAFGFSFQMPVVLSFAGRAGLVTAQQLRKGRKYAIVGIFAFAAFVTPPDPISQIILGIAIMGLYELSIWSVRIVEKRREEEEAAEAMAAGE